MLTLALALFRGARGRLVRKARSIEVAMFDVIGRLHVRSSFVRQEWPGAVPIHGARRVAVLAHFDGRGRIHRYVRYQAASLNAAGYAVILVSNAKSLQEADVAAVLPVVASVLRRKNVGRDIGAYRDGIAQLDLDEIDELVLVNDSVYGPFRTIDEIVGSMPAHRADVWGITDSWATRYHLQSYFLLFHRPALRSPGFARYWAKLPLSNSKNWLIRRGEIGLTQALLHAGLDVRAVYPYRDLVETLPSEHAAPAHDRRAADPWKRRPTIQDLLAVVERGQPLNPSHFFWRELIERGCPFLKRDLILSNPARVATLRSWRQTLTQHSPYDPDLIEDHLRHTARGLVF